VDAEDGISAEWKGVGHYLFCVLETSGSLLLYFNVFLSAFAAIEIQSIFQFVACLPIVCCATPLHLML